MATCANILPEGLSAIARGLQARYGVPVRLHQQRAARLRLSVRAGELDVRWPIGFPLDTGQAFLDAQADWIRAQLERHRQHAVQLHADLSLLDDPTGGQLLAFGEHCRADTAETVAWAPGRISLPPGYARLDRTGRRALIAQALADRLKQEVEARLPHYTEALGVAAQRCTIKVMESRWGSMSGNGRMSLALALAFAPLSTLDYVLAHELAHLHEPNHSKAFWAHVARVFPAFRHERQRLVREGRRWMGLQRALLGG
jgi:predicted metal-dependent hydrolase